MSNKQNEIYSEAKQKAWNEELKNGIGMAYRSLEQDCADLDMKWKAGELRLPLAEIEHKRKGLKEIIKLTKLLEGTLDKFESIAYKPDEDK